MRRLLCVLACLGGLVAPASAQTDYFRRIAVDPSGATSPGTSPVRFVGLPSRTSETACTWIDASGNLATGACGTVTSVGLSLPAVFTVTGSPVTTSGTLTATLASPWTWTTGGVFGTTTGNLTLQSAADLILAPSGSDILPDQGSTRNLGAATSKFGALHVAELIASTVVSQDTVATMGGRIMVTPTTVLTADVATGATSIQVQHNLLRVGDVVMLERGAQVEWMEVTSGPSGSGPYTYGVTRNLDLTGANSWSAGDAVVSTGRTGDGLLDLYAQRWSRQTGFAGAVMASRPKFYVSMDAPETGNTTQVFDAMTGWRASFANGATRASACGLGTGCPGNMAYRNPGPTYSNTAVALSDVSVNAALETGDVTIEAVVQQADRGVQAQTIVSRHWLGEWHLQIETSGTLTACQGDGTTFACWSSSVTVPLSTWTHVVMTRDAASRQICFYLDGSLGGCGTYSAVTIAQQNGSIAIGRSPVFAGGAFRGDISEVAIYTRRLTAAEIATHAERIPVNEFGWSSGPTIVGSVRTAATWNAIAPRWAIGNLNGLYDYVTTTYGAAFGDPAASWTAIDATRWRIMYGTTELMRAQSGALTLSGPLTVASSGGITLTADNAYVSRGALAWQRAYGGPTAGSGDRFAAYAISSGSTQQILLQNIARPTPTNTTDASSRIYLTAEGWNRTAQQSTPTSQILLASEPVVGWITFSTGSANLRLDEATSGMALTVTGAVEPRAIVQLRQGGNNNTEVYVPGRSSRTGTDFGSVVYVDRSTGTNNLPGMYLALSANGTFAFLWPDNAGLWRTASAPPEADGTPAQNSGTVVGDQTSRRADKIIERRWDDADQDEALRRILRTRIYDFRYRDGRYNGERFSGIVTDEAPWLGKDQNRALNEVNAVGYLIGALQALERRVAIMEAAQERDR